MRILDIDRRPTRYTVQQDREKEAPSEKFVQLRMLGLEVCESVSVHELFATKGEALQIGRNSFRVLNLLLQLCNCVACLYFKRDGLPQRGINGGHPALAASAQDEAERRRRLYVIVRQGATVQKLRAR